MAARNGEVSPRGSKKVTVNIGIYCDPRLKELASKAADAAGIPLSEFVVRVLAESLGRPELSAIPRKRMGRPRKAIAS